MVGHYTRHKRYKEQMVVERGRRGGEGEKRKEQKVLKCPSRTSKRFTFLHLGQKISQSGKLKITL